MGETQSLATIGSALEKSKQRLMAKLGDNIKWEYFASTFLTAIEKNPALLKCSQASLIKAAMDASQLRLITDGVLGQAYIVPYRQSAQFIIGYKGLIELCLRSGFVKKIGARAVYGGDKFDYEYGMESYCRHKPTLDERGSLIAVYAYYEMADGVKDFEVWSYPDLMAHKIKFAKGLDKQDKSGKWTSPWRIHETPMCIKTVLRSITKMLPKAIEDLSTVARIESDGYANEIIDIKANEAKVIESKDKFDQENRQLDALKKEDPADGKTETPTEQEKPVLGIADENAEPPDDLDDIPLPELIDQKEVSAFLAKARNLQIPTAEIISFVKKNGFSEATKITKEKYPGMMDGLDYLKK